MFCALSLSLSAPENRAEEVNFSHRQLRVGLPHPYKESHHRLTPRLNSFSISKQESQLQMSLENGSPRLWGKQPDVAGICTLAPPHLVTPHLHFYLSMAFPKPANLPSAKRPFHCATVSAQAYFKHPQRLTLSRRHKHRDQHPYQER